MTGHCSFHDLSTLDAPARAALMRRSETDLSAFEDGARPIIQAVRDEGDAALYRFARTLDHAEVAPGGLKVTPAEFEAAFGMVAPEVIEAIRYAIGNIRTFHETQKPEPMWLKEIRPGAFAGDRWTPIQSVALYVPRGKGAFPSVTMMTSVPAVIAGVPNVAICTPPAPDGSVDAATLVAARLAGVETVYKVGGAQAVAAVAYGTETVMRALKIVGPGSPWVVAAKQLLSRVIDTGLPAGPSEAIIFADGTVDGRLAALDLLIEAEHGPDSSAYLVTHSRAVAEAARDALAGSLGGHDGAAGRVLARGADRAARRDRADRLARGQLSASSTTTRRSIWKSCRPSRSRISARSPRRPKSCSARTRRSRSRTSCSAPTRCCRPAAGRARSDRCR